MVQAGERTGNAPLLPPLIAAATRRVPRGRARCAPPPCHVLRAPDSEDRLAVRPRSAAFQDASGMVLPSPSGEMPWFFRLRLREMPWDERMSGKSTPKGCRHKAWGFSPRNEPPQKSVSPEGAQAGTWPDREIGPAEALAPEDACRAAPRVEHARSEILKGRI